MNKRQWKKACYKAALELDRLFPNHFEFTPAAGSELVAAPAAFRSSFHGATVLRTHVFAPRGALLARYKNHPSMEEEPCRTALEVLEEVRENWGPSGPAIANSEDESFFRLLEAA